MAVTSSEDFFPAVEWFMASVKMTKAARAKAAPSTPGKPAQPGNKQQHAEQYMEYNTMLKQWVWKWRYPKSQ